MTPKTKALTGKGGLDVCPVCGGGISADDQDFIDYETMLRDIECRRCEKTFSELWKCVNWAEKK